LASWLAALREETTWHCGYVTGEVAASVLKVQHG
jgi:hypothetical protein